MPLKFIAYPKDYYDKFKDRIDKDFIKSQKEINREYVNYLKSNPCCDCGKCFDPVAMDFDHVRGIKFKPISAIINLGLSLDILLSELDKCELVCANCHRVRTKSRGYLRK